MRWDTLTKRERWTCEFHVPITREALDDKEFMDVVQNFSADRVHAIVGDTLMYSYAFNTEYFDGIEKKLAALQYLLCDKRVVKVRMDARTVLGNTKGSLLDLLRQIEAIEGSI